MSSLENIGNNANTAPSKSRAARKSFGGASPYGKLAQSPRHKLQVKETCQQAVKLASQGKVNKKNAWSMPLSDMATAHRASDKTNFQQQSVMLDAITTIYSYRVDNTMQESRQMQEELTRTKARKPTQNSDEEGGAGDNTDGDADGGHRNNRRKPTTTKTLCDNPATLMFKQPDLEFDVDPCFHQMSAKFDQGGGQGMLLNNLPVAQGCEIMFDSGSAKTPEDAATPGAASDTAGSTEDTSETAQDGEDTEGSTADADADEGAAGVCEGGQSPAAPVTESSVSLAALLPATTTASSFTEQLAGLRLCPQLRFFHDQASELAQHRSSSSGGAESAGTGDQAAIGGLAGFSAAAGAAAGGDGGAAAAEYLNDDLYDGNDDDGGYLSEDDHGDNDFGGFANDEGAHTGEGAVGGGDGGTLGNSDSGANHVNQLIDLIDPAGTSEFDFFDPARLAKVWAGPKFGRWKRMAPAGAKRSHKGASGDGGGRTGDGDGAADGTEGKRVRKQAYVIDFGAEPDEGAFEPAKKASSTQLSEAAIKKNEREAADLRLPVDLRYRPQQLVQLFLNSHLRFRSRGGGNAARRGGRPSESGGVLGVIGPDDGPASGDLGGYDLEFDGDDDCGGDDFGDDDCGGDNNTGFNLLASPQRVQKVELDYCKKAKKVDVKQLKGALWQRVGAQSGDADADADGESDGSGASTGKELSFHDTVQAVAGTQNANVTTPFYFICMLHLANEHGLELVGKDDLQDFGIIAHND